MTPAYNRDLGVTPLTAVGGARLHAHPFSVKNPKAGLESARLLLLERADIVHDLPALGLGQLLRDPATRWTELRKVAGGHARLEATSVPILRARQAHTMAAVAPPRRAIDFIASPIRGRAHVVGQAPLQEEPRPVHARLGRAQLDVQRLGDLGIREPFDIVQE